MDGSVQLSYASLLVGAEMEYISLFDNTCKLRSSLHILNHWE
jgi:hypothetical protein